VLRTRAPGDRCRTRSVPAATLPRLVPAHRARRAPRLVFSIRLPTRINLGGRPVRRCGQPQALPCAFGGACARLSKWLRATAARTCRFFGDDRAVVLSHVSVHRPGRASTSLAFLAPSAEGRVRGSASTVRSIRCTDDARELGERPIVASSRWANPRRLAQATRPSDAAKHLTVMIQSPRVSYRRWNAIPATSRWRQRIAVPIVARARPVALRSEQRGRRHVGATSRTNPATSKLASSTRVASSPSRIRSSLWRRTVDLGLVNGVGTTTLPRPPCALHFHPAETPSMPSQGPLRRVLREFAAH
jgi:hypothetical protein